MVPAVAVAGSALCTTGSSQVVADEAVHVGVQRGGEQQALGVRREPAHDRLDLGHEAQVGHVVGLVEHEDPDLARSTAPRSARSTRRPGVATTMSARSRPRI